MIRVWAALLIAGLLMVAVGGFASAVTKDCVRGGPGPDEMVGTAERDALCGEDGNDTVRGRGGNDALVGGADDDRVSGGAGDDGLKGGLGSDRLDGGPGDDVLRPGTYNRAEDGVRDRVRCGGGRDVVYATGRDLVADDCERRLG